jgi:hypothetical protein
VPPPQLHVRKGEVQVLFAYDVGLSIDLARAKEHVRDLTEPAQIEHRGHAPPHFQFDPVPLRVMHVAEELQVGTCRTRGGVELLLYDFGGVSVSYELPYAGPLDGLVGLSCELASSTALREDSLRRVQELMGVIDPAVHKGAIAPLTEDYLVFRVEAVEPPTTPAELVGGHAHVIARILRSESDPLSEQEIADATAVQVAFGPQDVALIDWNAALLFDRESEDARAVIEFANLQLLELRYLDEELDKALDRSYELVGRRSGLHRLRLSGEARRELGRVARLQVDSAILFERVNNALKLFGDQYLARIYRAASQRYRLNEWNTILLRKLETIESIYEKVHDQSVEFRMELLEWAIVILFVIDIALAFLVK